MSPALIVVVIIAVVGLLQIAIWVPLARSWNKKSAAFFADLAKEMATSGETLRIPQERASYEGATDVYGAVRGTGVIVLTDRRLLFRKKSGGVVEVPLGKVTAVREARSFAGVIVGGQMFLVVGTSDPAEVGFIVQDRAAWIAALGSR